MSLILEKFKQREAMKSGANQGMVQNIIQANLEPVKNHNIQEGLEKNEVIIADQILENEEVRIDGILAICKGKQSDGRIAFLKEGNSRNTLVESTKEVDIVVKNEITGEQTKIRYTPDTIINPQAKLAEKPIMNTKAPVEQEQEKHEVAVIPANNAVALPFEGIISAEMIKQLFEGNEAMIREALEEDVLPEGNFGWPEIVMKECMQANGQAEMLFALKHGDKQFSFPFKDGKTFKGIIIYQRSARACYEKDSKPGDKKPPICFSDDGIVPYGGQMISRTCKGCPYDVFGSSFKGGKGKACGDRIKLFIYVPEFQEVYLLDVSPMSRRTITTYLHNLAVNNPPINYKNIYTVFSCKGVYDGSTPYGVLDSITPAMIDSIEEYKNAIERRVQLKDMMTPGVPPNFPEKEEAPQASTL